MATHTFEPGMILECSWGWEQTNVDFFEVMARTDDGSFVTLKQLQSDLVQDGPNGPMSGHRTPRAGWYADAKVIRRKVKKAGDGTLFVGISKYQLAYAWDGRPRRCSWYA